MKEKNGNLTKIHQEYRTKSGMLVPGASTIAKMYPEGDKIDRLISWGINLYKEGHDFREVRKEKATIGSLAHDFIEYGLKDKLPDLSEYSPAVVERAQKSYQNYINWKKDKTIEPIITDDKDLVSEKYKFGGRVDFFGKVNGKYELTDYKTGGIWPSHWIQVAGYDLLLEENKYPRPEIYRIIAIPRTEKESFDEKYKTELTIYREIFKNLVDIYWLQNDLKSGG